MEDTRKKTLLSTCYEIHLRPTVILHNSLPVPLYLTTMGTSTQFEILPGASCNLSTVEPGSSSVVMKVTRPQLSNKSQLNKTKQTDWADQGLHGPWLVLQRGDPPQSGRAVRMDSDVTERRRQVDAGAGSLLQRPRLDAAHHRLLPVLDDQQHRAIAGLQSKSLSSCCHPHRRIVVVGVCSGRFLPPFIFIVIYHSFSSLHFCISLFLLFSFLCLFDSFFFSPPESYGFCSYFVFVSVYVSVRFRRSGIALNLDFSHAAIPWPAALKSNPIIVSISGVDLN